VHFYVDQHASRVGILTTEEVKYAMCQLVIVMLKERRIHMRDPLLSNTPEECKLRLREQMEIYGYQTKAAADTFSKDKVALSGKVGGMKDDICICLQLACYFTQKETQRAADARPIAR
jgi:hypothetical protein